MVASFSHSFTRAFDVGVATEIRAFWRRRPVDPNLVVLESFGGNGALCNPEAIFRELVAAAEFSSLRFVWSLRHGHEGDVILREFGGDRRVSFVTQGTPAYSRAVMTAGYLVTNSTFPRWFSRRPGQVVVNTWHGTPLKKMGFDIGDRPARVANVLRNFLHSDYLLSTGPYMTDTMYREAHRLEGIYDGRVLEVGSPRVDAQFAGSAALEKTRRALREAGIDQGARQLVLFAPTWKGANSLRPVDDAAILLDQVTELQNELGDGYLVVLKVHQAVHKFASGRIPSGTLVPNDLPTNAVLAVTDQLVTDYSSVFFDFLASERPIHFFVPDLADYGDYRGLYLEPSTWPGTITSTPADLAAAIRAPQTAAAADASRAARARFAAGEDGHATRRVVDAVFRKTAVEGCVVRLDESAKRRSVILVGGPPDPWSGADVDAAIAAIDLTQVDLTVVVSDSHRDEFVAWQATLDRRIRVVVRQGVVGGSKLWALLERVTGRRPRAQWEAEWVRLFGLSRIDEVTSLATSGFWGALAAAWPSAEPSAEPSARPSGRSVS